MSRTADNLPSYDGQGIENYTTLMVRAVASRLRVPEPHTHIEVYIEDELRAEIEEARPDALVLLDEVMTAYRNWIEAREEAKSKGYDEDDDNEDEEWELLRVRRVRAESLHRDLAKLISS